MSTNLTAHAFAGTPHGGEFSFGIQNAASALRRLADRIDAGTAIVSQATIESTASHEEFTFSLLHLRFAERVPKQG